MIIQSEEKSLRDVKISIGVPVYNGEKFIHKKLDSLLEQTFTDFEIIISDNGSTDMTPTICEKYAKFDNRIRFFRQEKNIGMLKNFEFVFQQAKGKYFMWTAADDIILPTFIEKNIAVLEERNNVSCSISKIRLYSETTDHVNSKNNDSVIHKIKKKIISRMGYMNTYPVSGTYKKRMNQFFKKLRHNQIFYGVYRTEQLRKSAVFNKFLGNDTATTINILKFGELNVIDEVLMQTFDKGVSRSGMIDLLRHLEHNGFGIIFPYFPFTIWCVKNINKEIFLRNIIFFIKINLIGELSLLVDLTRLIRQKFF